MNYQNLNKNFKLYSFIISIFTILLFLFGFYVQENSAGAGGFDGDFTHVWNNLLLFKNNNFWLALDATAGLNENDYKSSRPPLIYILNAYLNPFVEDKQSYILSIFALSLLTYLLFYYSIYKKYKRELNHANIIFLSIIILLSPYFRTSAYWGLEENFGILSVVISYIFFRKIIELKFINLNLNLFLLVFFSSLSVYFDQKLIIFPSYFFLKLLFEKKININEKINLSIFYTFLSIPFIYLIYTWGNIIPVTDAEVRNTLKKIYFENLGFSLTIIAFYIFPFLFLKKENIFLIFRKKIKSYNFYIFLLFLIFYVLFLVKVDPLEKELLGNGIVYKLSLILFNNFELSKIFLYLSFFVSLLIIHLFIDDNRDYLFIIFLIVSSIFITPLLQEYFDPLILILVLLFFFTKLYFSFFRFVFLYFYFFIFLIITNMHYNLNYFSFF